MRKIKENCPNALSEGCYNAVYCLFIQICFSEVQEIDRRSFQHVQYILDSSQKSRKSFCDFNTEDKQIASGIGPKGNNYPILVSLLNLFGSCEF